MKKALTTGEIAEYCGVHFRTVLRWIERGRLNAYRLPGRGDNRVRLEDFLEFLRSNQMPVPEDFADSKPEKSKQRRVLVVEDDPNTAGMYRKILEGVGYEVLIATDGFQAGALMGTYQPALMTLDLGIPNLSGLEVLRFVRQTAELSGTKILVISSMPRHVLREAEEAGANQCLEKPVDRTSLISAVESMLAQPAAVTSP